MKNLKKVFSVLLIVIAFLLLLTVKTSAVVDSKLVTDDIRVITFDSEYYLDCYSDLKAAFGNDEEKAYNHFLTFGIKEGRCANLTFDVKYYLSIYPDLQKAFGKTNYEAAYKHFIEFGAKEGRTGCRIYNSSYYLLNNADVKKAYNGNPLKAYSHYVYFGVKEGRRACEEFNAKCYLNKYSDLTKAFTGELKYKQAFEHYLVFGIKEKRIGVHEYAVVETVEATCEKAGYTVEKCACGDEIKLTIPLKSHSYDDGVVTKEATCAEEGVKTYTCTVCGATKTEAIAKVDHTSDGGTVTLAAKCDKKGERTYKCTVCGAIINTEEIPALGHDYSYEVSKDDETKHIKSCSHEETTTTEDHTYGDAVESETYGNGVYEATCTKCGYKKYYTSSAETKEITVVEEDDNLATTISSAKDGDVILLTDNASTENKELNISKSITLNLGTSTLNTGTSRLVIGSGATVTIDGTENGKISGSGDTSEIKVDGGTLVVNGGAIESLNNYAIFPTNGGKVVLNDGTSITSKYPCISSNNLRGNMDVTINSGVSLTAKDGLAIYMPAANDSVTINDGVTIDGGILVRSGTLTINGGTISGPSSKTDEIISKYSQSTELELGNAIAVLPGIYSSNSEIKININGGTIKGNCNGCATIGVYNLGKYSQNTTINVASTATLSNTDSTSGIYKLMNATEITSDTSYTANAGTVTYNNSANN